MNRWIAGAALVLGFALSGATAALAVTQEYTITVPFTLKGFAAGASGQSQLRSMGGLTMWCAVGAGDLAYSTGSGTATGAAGLGSARVALQRPDGSMVTFPLSVPVTLTADVASDARTGLATGRGPTNYVCWGKFDNGPTPINFVQGTIPGRGV
jgi:hypothetical protein